MPCPHPFPLPRLHTCLPARLHSSPHTCPRARVKTHMSAHILIAPFVEAGCRLSLRIRSHRSWSLRQVTISDRWHQRPIRPAVKGLANPDPSTPLTLAPFG